MDKTVAENAERRAARIGGALLFALAAYVVGGAGWKLWMQEGAEFSLPGLIVTVLAMPIMYFLSRRKLHLAEALGSRALRANAIESITCGWLSLVVVAALLAQLVIGVWWADAAASLGIVWFACPRRPGGLGRGTMLRSLRLKHVSGGRRDCRPIRVIIGHRKHRRQSASWSRCS